MSTTSRNETPRIPLGPTRIAVGGEHFRCMADTPVTLVPVSDIGCGYPWWIAPDSIDGLALVPGTAYVLDVVITARPGTGGRLSETFEYRLVEVVESVETGTTEPTDSDCSSAA